MVSYLHEKSDTCCDIVERLYKHLGDIMTQMPVQCYFPIVCTVFYQDDFFPDISRRLKHMFVFFSAMTCSANFDKGANFQHI